MKKILNTSMVYFILAIVAGVFYREFTKFSGYTGKTTLSVVHTHLFVFGMILFLIIALFESKENSLSKDKTFKRFFVLYNISLPLMACMLVVRGVIQVLGIALSKGGSAAISGIAGIAHILITIALFMLFSALKRCLIKNEN